MYLAHLKRVEDIILGLASNATVETLTKGLMEQVGRAIEPMSWLLGIRLSCET
ncbi:hypothetical protein AGMMS49941_13470 [Deferribacterales bacterium]|nr:hypothetical protein AGMMS49941_13470 [Deferribacterales bacterium]